MALLKALRRYSENYADAQIAKDRLSDPKPKIISGAELRKRLETKLSRNYKQCRIKEKT